MTKKTKVVTGILVSAVTSSMLSGAVYIVPSDIDQYKQKTDQSFYDMYQNHDSVIANGVNGQMKAFTDAIDTSSKIATGATVNRVGQTNVAGVPVKGGTKGSFTFNGHKYTINIAKNGEPSLSGYLADGKGHIAMKGTHAISPRGTYVASSGKYDMVKQRYADEVFFDLPTGTLTKTTVAQQRSWHNNGKYGWQPVNNWHTTNLVNIDKQQLGLAQLLTNNDITGRSFTAYPKSQSSGNNGKYDS